MIASHGTIKPKPISMLATILLPMKILAASVSHRVRRKLPTTWTLIGVTVTITKSPKPQEQTMTIRVMLIDLSTAHQNPTALMSEAAICLTVVLSDFRSASWHAITESPVIITEFMKIMTMKKIITKKFMQRIIY